tara:strand:+ start:1251 stop:1430 length:180 start_codon:yes stop_codon:yes gene_type:complete
MKVKSKDEIITCLIDMLSQNDERRSSSYLTYKGWIESLKWVLGLTKEERNVFKETEVEE